MWIPTQLIEWIEVSKEAYQDLKSENSALKAELATVKTDLVATRINADWFRMKINDLELTNKALLERAYQIQLPVPTIVREQPRDPNPYKLPLAIFDHIDDETAKALGSEHLT